MTIKEFRAKYGVKICTDHTGKMTGIDSLSTSVLLNPICQKRAQDKTSVCSKCYAGRMAKMYKGLEKVLAGNTEVLTEKVIPVEEWPLLNARIFRLEAFGDLQNVTQVRNYFNFARRNPETTFALWTKNPAIIARAIRYGSTPPR